MEQIMISIGQEAVVVHHGRWDSKVQFGYTVTKVTPTGQVTITNQDGRTRRFNKKGFEMGTPSSSYNRDMVRFDIDELQEQESRKDRAIAAAQAINFIDKPNNVTRYYSKEVMYAELDALQRQIDEARKVVDLM
jgi:hypothetical protein